MKTLCYISASNDPYFNLAWEEWAVRNLNSNDCQYLILYVNKPAVVVGRNQNLFEEVNIPYCKEKGIAICRRVSGGGTVFHDEGNLNWTFITSASLQKVNNYKAFAQPVINVIDKLGLTAHLTNRNAIQVGEVKVSGQAQFTSKNNLLSHGTLLVHSNLTVLQPAIEKNEHLLIQSKASQSVRSTTQNLRSLTGNKLLTIEEIINLLKQELGAEQEVLSPEIEKEIHTLSEVYKSQVWIYERSPKSTVDSTYLIDGKQEALSVDLVKGRVQVVRNKKGDTLQYHPFLYQSYEKILDNYSL